MVVKVLTGLAVAAMLVFAAPKACEKCDTNKSGASEQNVTMGKCGKKNCKCGEDCKCGTNCKCSKKHKKHKACDMNKSCDKPKVCDLNKSDK